jgi:virginiamycin B lyase
MRKILSLFSLAMLYACVVSAATGGTISGVVKGPDGAPFRAAFVRAQNTKSKVTFMVLSDNQGRYFTDKLPAGSYNIWATAIGYKSDPVRRTDVAVEEGKDMNIGFVMQKSAVQWSQLTKYQAGTLLPDAPKKGEFLQGCTNCHMMSKIGAVGRNDRDGWIERIDTMRQVGVARITPEVANTVASYLENALGPDSTLPLSPAQLPAYKAVAQEGDYFSDDALGIEYVDYELGGDPRDRPGTAKPDKDGMMWAEVDGGTTRINPDTGEIKTWRLPEPYNHSSIHEILPTPDGSVWLTLQSEDGLARFDTKTEKYEVFIDKAANDKYNATKPVQKDPNDPWPNLPNPAGDQGGAARAHTAVMDHDGNLWVSGRPLKKFDPKTKEFTFFSSEVPDSYGIAVDQKGNVWAAEFNAKDHQDIVMVDVKTDKVTHYQPPAGVSSRRLKVDSKGMIWVGDYFGGNATRFDPNTKQFKEYKMPGPMPTPYGFTVDHNDHVWYASMYTDVMGELNPTTGKFIEYPSPYGERGTRDLTEDAQGRIWYGAQPYFKVGYVRVRSESERPIAQSR